MNDDDTDIRMLFQQALSAPEPAQRDLAGPAVSVVLNGRKRMRVLTYSASVVAVVAVAAAITAGVVGSGGGRKAVVVGDPTGTPTPSRTPSAGSTAAAETSAWDKQQDILDRLPELLNAVLPAGYRLGGQDGELNGPAFLLTGPTGTNSVSVTATPAAEVRTEDLPGPQNCVASGGRCSSRAVAGGTLYLQLKDFPANYGGAGGFKPGTEKTILSFDDDYTFVPASKTGYSYRIRLSAEEAHAQYADKPPADWTGGTWPPNSDIGNSIPAFNSGGALISPEQFVTMVGNPAMAAVGTLLDDKTPPAQAAVDKRKQADATILAATKDALPAGLTLSIDSRSSMSMSGLLLTGPSGDNAFTWQTAKQQPTWRHGSACETHTQKNCTASDVPGGELAVTSPSVTRMGDGSQATWYRPGTTDQSAFTDVRYEYLPDDPNGTVVSLTLRAQTEDIPWASTRPQNWPDGAWPPPARDGEPFDAAGALLTPEQFVALAKSPGIVNTVTTVNGFLR